MKITFLLPIVLILLFSGVASATIIYSNNGTYSTTDGINYDILLDNFPFMCGFSTTTGQQVHCAGISISINHTNQFIARKVVSSTLSNNFTFLLEKSGGIYDNTNFTFGYNGIYGRILKYNGVEKVAIYNISGIDSDAFPDDYSNVVLYYESTCSNCYSSSKAIKLKHFDDGLTQLYLNDSLAISNYLTVTGVEKVVIKSNGTIAADNLYLIDNLLLTTGAFPDYDPSGYINDTNGNAIFNARITLANATWNTTAYSDATGYWNTDIYANGTYNYNVSLNGYTTLSGSQAYVIGGTNYNYTLTPNKGRISGTVYEYTNESGSKSIVGDLKSLKEIFAGFNKYKLYLGATVTLYAPDSKTYVLKNYDVDISGTTAIIQILESGVVKFEEYVEPNKDYRYKVSETVTTELYLIVKVGTIFSGAGGETSWIEVTPSYDVRQKSTTSVLDIVSFWNTYFNSGTTGLVLFFYDLSNWLLMSPSNPDMKVGYNASSGRDAEAETIMDFSSDTSITTFFLGIRTNNNDATAGKIGYGFTDDGIEVAPGYTDVYIQTGTNQYLSDYRKFSDVDTDGDKKIKVWLYFYSGYGSKWDFNYYVTGFCTGCNLKPLPDALIYQSYTNSTKSNNFGFYNLYIPFGTYNISYSKDGYESKSYSFTVNATNNTFTQDVTINKSTTTITDPLHYVKVLPDPSSFGTQISAYFKTLNTYSYYRITVCPFNDEANCYDIYDSDFGVAPNTESFVPLKQYQIGTYSLYLSGKNLFDWSYTTVASNNFTITSSIPVAAWESSTYYLGDTMKINIYIPSGTQNLTAYYPNGSILFASDFSAATTVQNKTFATTLNSTAGKYTVKITGNANLSVTELLPIAASDYNLTVPDSVVWGKSFTVKYQSPKTSELVITKSDGSLAYAQKTVVGSKMATYNTSSLENKADTLTVQLVQNNVVKASKNIGIDKDQSTETGAQRATALADLLDSNLFWALLFTVGMMAAVAYATAAKR